VAGLRRRKGKKWEGPDQKNAEIFQPKTREKCRGFVGSEVKWATSSEERRAQSTSRLGDHARKLVRAN